MTKKRFCRECGEVVKRVATTNTNMKFCSTTCVIKYYKDMRDLIKKTEHELKRLKEELKNAKLTI
jgi:hypothetical protein